MIAPLHSTLHELAVRLALNQKGRFMSSPPQRETAQTMEQVD